MENRWFPPKGDFHIWLLSKWRILLKQHDQRNLFLRYPLSSVHSRFENEAYVSTENSRFTNDPRSITSLLHGTSHQLSPEVEGGGGGGREWGEGGGAGRRILGLNGMLFRGIRSIIQWDNQILRFPPTHLSPQAINMTGSLTENFDAFTDLSCRGYLKHFLTQHFSSVCFSVTVPLSSDSFWSNLKSQFTGRSHRALFEESLKEIYRNMYNTVKEAHY